MNRNLFISTVLAISAVGCGDPLKDGQRIEELRVLGARVAIDGAPGRATPAAGEAASVEWLLADPSGLPAQAIWSMTVCVAESTNFGIPICRDAPLASVEQTEPNDTAPSIAFTVPDASELGDAEKLAVLAIFCDSGTVELGSDLESSTCQGAGTIQKASFDILLASDDVANDNPDLDDAVLEIDGDTWDAGSAVVDCATDEVPRLAADGQEHDVRLVLGDGVREMKPADEVEDPEPESLQISQLSTLGKFDSRFSGVDPEDSNLSVEIPWTAPGEVDSASPVSFYFVVRDDRGGVSWLTRTACVEP